MQKEFAVSLQKEDNGRVFLNGVLSENDARHDAFFVFLYRVTEGLDVTQSVIIHVTVLKKSDVREIAGTADDFEKLLKNSWQKCEPVDFESWFEKTLEFDWNIAENNSFPYDADIFEKEQIDERNSRLLKAWESRKEALSIDKKLEEISSLKSFSTEIYNELKNIASESSRNDKIIKKHSEELKRHIDIAFEHLASFREIEENKNCNEISFLVDDAISFAKKGENFKEIFAKLQSLQNKIKTSVLNEDVRFMFKNLLNDAFAVLKERQKAYFENIEELRDKNYQEMNTIIEECIDAAKNFEKFKDAWKLLKSANEKFNGLKMDREKYHLLKEKMSEAFDILKKREKAYFDEIEQEWKDNYSAISEHISDVLSKIEDESKQHEVWEELKEIQNELKDTRIKKEEQNELWDKVKAAFEIVKEKRDAAKIDFNRISKEKYKKLIEEAEEVLNTAYFNKSFNDAFNIIKDLQKRVFEEKYLTKEKREALKEKIGRAFEVLKNRRERYYAEKETAPKDSSEK